MGKQYLNAMEEWERTNNEPPSAHLHKMLLGWEELVNQAYIDGYNDGLEKKLYRTKVDGGKHKEQIAV